MCLNGSAYMDEDDLLEDGVDDFISTPKESGAVED